MSVVSRTAIEKYVPHLALAVTLVFFVFGASLGCYSNAFPVNPGVNASLFLKVVVQNTGFALFIFLGSLFLNITTCCLLIYNGISWGKSFKDVYCNTGLEETIFLVLPHIFIEIAWILMACQLSVKMSFQVLDLFYDRISAEEFYDVFTKNYSTSLIMIFSFIVIGAVIECFITPLLIY